MLKNDNLALFVAFLWLFSYENFGSPYLGFYIIPVILAILAYFYSPLISRELNGILAFFTGVVSTSFINMDFIFFNVPFFLILSSILYVFAKK